MRLTAGDAELVLSPTIGGTIVSWTVGDFPVLRPSRPGAADPREQACYPLIPFSNRVANRGFVFEGTRYTLPALLGDWAIHGVAWQRTWWPEETRQDGARLVLEYPGGTLWPFAFRAEQTFELTGHGLAITMRITNHHDGTAPAAIGLHPFFRRSDSTTLQFSAASVWQNGPDMIPTENTEVPAAWDFATSRTPGEVAIDNCFAGWDGAAEVTWPDHGVSLAIRADAAFPHLVVYVPTHGEFMAVEPVANMNDGLNRMDGTDDHGMTLLSPGETLEGRITMSVSGL